MIFCGGEKGERKNREFSGSIDLASAEGMGEWEERGKGESGEEWGLPLFLGKGEGGIVVGQNLVWGKGKVGPIGVTGPAAFGNRGARGEREGRGAGPKEKGGKDF